MPGYGFSATPSVGCSGERDQHAHAPSTVSAALLADTFPVPDPRSARCTRGFVRSANRSPPATTLTPVGVPDSAFSEFIIAHIAPAQPLAVALASPRAVLASTVRARASPARARITVRSLATSRSKYNFLCATSKLYPPGPSHAGSK
jgi:hypothetical protein